MKVILFPNGHVAVFDERGDQVPEAQRPWLLDVANRLASLGYDPTLASYLLPDGRTARVFTTESGFNWEVK